MSSGSNSRGSRGSQSLKNFAASSSPASKRDDISELYGNDHADALWIGKTLLNSKGIMSRFVFTHKAIWCAEPGVLILLFLLFSHILSQKLQTTVKPLQALFMIWLNNLF